jgi:hypothetical protein
VPKRLTRVLLASVLLMSCVSDGDASAAGHCFNPPIAAVQAGDLCHIGATSAAPTFLLWGDSHADSIAGAVATAAKAHGQAGLFAAKAACQPLLDVQRIGKDATCVEFNRAVAALVTGHERIGTVILAARWVIAARGTRYKFEPGDRVEIRDAEFTAGEDNEAVFRRGLARTLEALANAHKRIVVIGPLPEIGWRVPDALAKAPLDVGPTVAEFRSRQQPVLRAFAALAAKVPFEVIWPQRVLCNTDRCPAVVDGKPLYRDEEHVSAYGAHRLVPLLSPIFEATAAAREP